MALCCEAHQRRVPAKRGAEILRQFKGLKASPEPTNKGMFERRKAAERRYFQLLRTVIRELSDADRAAKVQTDEQPASDAAL